MLDGRIPHVGSRHRQDRPRHGLELHVFPARHHHDIRHARPGRENHARGICRMRPHPGGRMAGRRAATQGYKETELTGSPIGL